MKVGLDARALQDGYKTHAHRGIGAFTRSLYEALGRVGGSDVSFALIVDPAYPAPHPGLHDASGASPARPFETHTLSASGGPSALSAHVPWEHGRRFRSLPYDALYFPHFEDAPRQGGGPPRFVTVHDCIPFLESGPYKRAAILRSVRGLMARRILRSAHVAAISRTTRRDITRLFGLDSDDIALLVPSPHPQFRESDAAAPGQTDEAREAFDALDLPARYVLATGGADPRKRNQALVTAWPLLADGAGAEPLHLVIAGSPTRAEWETDLLSTIHESPAAALIQRLPTVSFSALPALYRNAQMLAFLSTHEGFGLPPLEAMACGTPVLATRQDAVAEAAGNAVYWVESVEAQVLAGPIRNLTENTALRSDLIALGRERIARYSWEDTARTLLTWIRANLDR